jgi:hypothetical protein
MKGASFTVAMKSVHRMVHQADRPDGAVEWGCPQCGRYTVCHPRWRDVVLAGEPESVHVPGAGFPPAAEDPPTPSESDLRWLGGLEIVW